MVLYFIYFSSGIRSLNVSITSDPQRSMIGINQSLVCQVNVIDELVVPISLTWIKTNGLNSTIHSTTGNFSNYPFPYLSKEDSAHEIIAYANAK